MRGHQLVVSEVVADHEARSSGSTGRMPSSSRPAAGTTASGSLSSGGTGGVRSASCCAALSLVSFSRFISRTKAATMRARPRMVPQISPVITTGSGVIGGLLGWQERERRLVRLVAGPERPLACPQQPLPEGLRALPLPRVGELAEFHDWFSSLLVLGFGMFPVAARSASTMSANRANTSASVSRIVWRADGCRLFAAALQVRPRATGALSRRNAPIRRTTARRVISQLSRASRAAQVLPRSRAGVKIAQAITTTAKIRHQYRTAQVLTPVLTLASRCLHGPPGHA